MTSKKHEITTHIFEPANPDDLRREEQRIKEYWTKERRGSAIPIPLPKRTARPPTQAPTRTKPRGEYYATQQVATTDLRGSPYSSVGKLFMTFSGTNYVGSGWVIGNRSIFTAGHCLHDRSTFATNVAFAPAYDSGGPMWTVGSMAVLTGWIKDGDNLHDQAAGVTLTPISQDTGNLSWAANRNINSGPYLQLGYPAAPVSGYNFDGQHMWKTDSTYISDSGWAIDAWGNMSGGVSGGPWLIKIGNDLLVNGMSVARYDGEDEHLLSPYFGDETRALVKQLADWGAY